MHPQSGEATISAPTSSGSPTSRGAPPPRPPGQARPRRARDLLETQHYGLEKVKKRILEYLSVRKLAPNKRGPILCLVGPPGVGKTSLGRSIAEALGRQYVRISLGGVRDDAEIRGHRRTYIGALPGRFIQAMKRAGTCNPVIVLDEIDKLVGSNLRGDPAGALLEALDPEQNEAFRDHYLDLDYDLSKVIFLCTANELGAIPGRPARPPRGHPAQRLHHRGEAGDRPPHLLPKQRAENGLADVAVELGDDVLLALATQYTRESGVRNLERELAALLRDIAMHLAEGKAPRTDPRRGRAPARARPAALPRRARRQGSRPIGVVTGLGWTPVGGTLLFVEANIDPGTGQIRLTGKLGDVMKESAQAALSFVRSRGAEFGISPILNKRLKDHDLHLHFPPAPSRRTDPAPASPSPPPSSRCSPAGPRAPTSP
jgi:ATP-dependent Lon protease